MGKERLGPFGKDRQRGSYLGPAFSQDAVKEFLESRGYPYHELSAAERPLRIAEKIADGQIVGYFSGRMEFGPRALGARSILGDARRSETQRIMNLKIKFRESFRPFAPSVLEERAGDFFEIDRPSPYMLLVAKVNRAHSLPTGNDEGMSMNERLYRKRSDIPAVTHLDYSARLQTVNSHDKPDYHAVISRFAGLTGCPVIVNTSFNVRGEPIVCTPEDAYRCFMRTEMDALVLENCMLEKAEQPPWTEDEKWRNELQPD
jgi:carbamoyltransferase